MFFFYFDNNGKKEIFNGKMATAKPVRTTRLYRHNEFKLSEINKIQNILEVSL